MNLIKRAFMAISLCLSFAAQADNVLVIDGQYNSATTNVVSRLQAAGHTVTTTTSISSIPSGTGTYQQVWDLRYSAALTSTEVTNYTQFITAGGFAYFVTENPGCCMTRNNSIAQLVTDLGGGSTQIGPGWASNVNTNMNTTYMTQGITVNYLAVAAIVNSQGIPLIRDANNNVSGMSWIGRAGALGSGVTGTIVTVADVNWLSEAWGTQNQQALDDIITGIVAGTVGGTISASGNGSAATNGAAQQQNNTPTLVSSVAGTSTVTTTTLNSTSTTVNVVTYGNNQGTKNLTVTKTTTPVTTTTTVTRVTTTPTTIETYSDNSTQTVNGTPVVNDVTTVTVSSGSPTTELFATRIDQLTTLDLINRRLNQANDSNILARQSVKDGKFVGDHASTVYIVGQGQRSNTYDGYNYRTSRYGIGADYRVDQDLMIGWQFVRSDTKLTGSAGIGSLDKDVFSLHSAYTQDDWIIRNELGLARNKFFSGHSLSELGASNSAKTDGQDLWTSARVYTPSVEGFRPFAGARWERNQRDGVTETGTQLTAATHSAVNQSTISSEVGVRYELTLDTGKFYTEVARTSQQLTRAHIGASTKIDKETAIRVQVGQERQLGVVNRTLQADLRWLF